MPTMGVYTIRNNVTGRFYIGASVNIERRWKQHHKNLNDGVATGENRHLCDDWKVYGPEAFTFSIVKSTTTLWEAAAKEYCMTQDALADGKPLYNRWAMLHGRLAPDEHSLADAAILMHITGREHIDEALRYYKAFDRLAAAVMLEDDETRDRILRNAQPPEA